jgi:hypothetical protein
MIPEDIRNALNRGHKKHAGELLIVLRQFLAAHPEASKKKHA